MSERDGAGWDGEDTGQVERGAMVVEQLARRGIRDPRVLSAMATVPRHMFVEPRLRDQAYKDGPLPIGFGQTISQPYMVARATELAAPERGDRALEIGVGSGYQAAVLSQMGAEVYGLEIIPALANAARDVLAELSPGAIHVEISDGSGGWPQHAPYDVIIVSAGAPRIPALLLDQLADGGRLVIPIGPVGDQTLTLVQRSAHHYQVTSDTACRYVDLVGRYGVGHQMVAS